MRLFMIALALLFACAKSEQKPAGTTELATMTLDEVDQGLATKAVVPVDCNTDRTRHKVGVVPGAILVSEDDSYAASELPADKTTKLVFYCANPG